MVPSASPSHGSPPRAMEATGNEPEGPMKKTPQAPTPRFGKLDYARLKI